MTDYINFGDFIKKSKKIDDKEAMMVFDDDVIIDDPTLLKLYQVQATEDSNIIKIKHVGIAKEKPFVKLGEHTYKNYSINIISYILTESDIINNKNVNLKMFGLIVKNKNSNFNDNNILYSLDYTFYDFKTKINNINDDINKEYNGFFSYEIYTKTKDKIMTKRIKHDNEYKGHKKIIEEMITLLITNYL